MNNLIKIREVSLRYDVSARALKYYEDMGLIQSQKSDDYAYRLYNETAIKRLEQILILRKLNIKVKDIQRIFNSSSSDVVLEVLSQKVTDIDDEVALLNEFKEIVLDFIKQLEKFDFRDNDDIKLLYEKVNDIERQIVNVDYNGNPPNVNRLLEVTGKLNKSYDIRVIKFPKMKMISSGPIKDMKEFDEFDNWWSGIDINNYITPRDFLYFDNNEKCMIWLFAPPENFINTSLLIFKEVFMLFVHRRMAMVLIWSNQKQLCENGLRAASVLKNLLKVTIYVRDMSLVMCVHQKFLKKKWGII